METERPVVWADIFFAVLSEPRKTLRVLADSSQYEPDRTALFAAGLMVVLANVIGDIASRALAGSSPALIEIVGGAFSAIFFWLTLALILKFLSSWRNRAVSWGNCLCATGWAFLPFIFKAPIMCFALALPFCTIFMTVVEIWFCFLEIEVFDSVLQLGKLKMVTLLIFLPPLLTCAYLFWAILTSGLIIGAFISAISPS